MATRAEYKAQGYTDQQINDAVAKKSATVQQSAGPDAPISAQPVTNPNLVPFTSAPVAPVSPDIAPAMREGTAAVPVAQAPVTQVPVQTPQTVAQVAPVSPDIAPSERPGTAAVVQPAVAPVVAPKVEAVAKKTTAPKVAAAQTVNYDSSVGRDQEILANLSEGYKNAPDLFADEATFRASYGYATADEGKKRMLDAFYQAKQPKNEDQFFSILASGGRVWNESSKALPAYQSAVKRFEDIQKYKGFTSSQFSSALSNGQIIPGSRVYRDLQNDPVAKVNMEKAVTLNRINGVGTNENKVRETVMADIGTSPFGKAVADGFIDATEANALMTTPEIKQKQDQIEPLKNEYDRLKASYDDVETQVDEELKGTGATSSYRDALIGARRKNIYKNLQVATDTYNNAIGSLADMKKTQSDLLSMNLGLYKDQQAFQKQKELAQFQNDLKNKGIETQVIKDELTGKQALINSRTGEIIKSYETGAKAGTGTNFQQIKQTDELGRETVVGYFDPTTGKSTYYGAGAGVVPTVGQPVSFSGSGSGFSGQGGMRTDRHNNPAAFTTDIAKQAGLVEGVDYEVGDPFGGGKYNTARLLGDPIDTTIRVIDKIGFKTKSGVNRWSYSDKIGLTNESWAKMTPEQKMNGIYKMYQQEGGNGSLFGNGPEQTSVAPSQAPASSGFDPNKSALYETVIKSSPKDLYAKGYRTSQERDAIMAEAIKWASSGGETAKDRQEKAKISKSDALDRIDKFSASQTSKDFKLAKPNISKVISNAEQDSAAADIALIFGFMKQLDPQSTVREGEFATAQNSGGVPDAVRNAWNKAISGERLQPSQREDFVKTSVGAYKSQLSAYNEEVRNMRKVAETLGIDTSAFPKEETFLRKFKDGTAIEYDGLGKYRYLDKSKKWSGWQNEGVPQSPQSVQPSSATPKKSAAERARELRNTK